MRAILLVAFGTSVLQAQKVFDSVHERVRAGFPDVEIRWAYTSRIIRAKLAREGRFIDSPEMALSRMMDEGFRKVGVLSLHVFPGKEFHDLFRNADLFSRMADGFDRVIVAPPLLSSYDDMSRVAKGLLRRLPEHRKPDEAVIFMGHGNERHPADTLYAAMHYIVQDLDPNAYVATVLGRPTIGDLLPKLSAKGVTKAYLLPLMSVAGEHARQDMAGDKPDSWKSILARNGIESESILVGLAEYDEIVEIWLDNLRKVLSE